MWGDIMETLYVVADSGSTVNLRAEPSTSSQLIQRIPITSSVEVVEKTSTEWYKIKYQTTEGYIMSKFLSNKSHIVTKTDLRKIYNSLAETLKIIEKVLQ